MSSLLKRSGIAWAVEQMPHRLKFYSWAAKHYPLADRSCPFCKSKQTILIERKLFVTALFQCTQCDLRFRVPKETASQAKEFYQEDYSYGFTTDCPDDETLRQLKDSRFANTEKDYSTYLKVLQAVGLQPGQTILDFGASWGYGSWQLAQAGYKVYSYEISQPRARYAAEKLGCAMLPTPTAVPEKVDCLFSAHVMEHLTDPGEYWEVAASVLKPDGMIVTFIPNGDLEYQKSNPNHYHQLWGRVHPLLIGSKALTVMAARYNFSGHTYSSMGTPDDTYDLNQIQAQVSGASLRGTELLFVAHRQPESQLVGLA